MTLYESWKRITFDTRGEVISREWDKFAACETNIYRRIISRKINKISGKVGELAKDFGAPPNYFAAFLDGISEAVDNLPDAKKLEIDDEIEFEIDFIRLYKKMVEFKAKHLYTLSEWIEIFPEEEQFRLYREEKASHIIIKGKKIGRNESCPCGSGKKYKNCCLTNAQ